MARPSKLSPEQWREIERRSAEGESCRALARAFGVDESSIRARVSPQTPRVKAVAEKLVEAQTALESLPLAQQYRAMSLAEKLRNISRSLASAAELGAATAHRSAALANSEINKVDDATVLSDESVTAMKGVAVLTKLANDSAHIALNLLAANKDRVLKLDGEEDAESGATALVKELKRRRAAGGKTVLLPGMAKELDDGG